MRLRWLTRLLTALVLVLMPTLLLGQSTSPWSGGPTGPIYYSSGNVGIGTANPGYVLDVQGSANAIGRILTSSSSLGYLDLQNTNLGTTGNGLDLRLITENSSGTGLAVVDMVKYANGGFIINNTDSAGSTSFGTAGVIRMRINANGYVGFGTTNPQSLLAVNGTITTKEVMVTSVGWSDYVFRDGYRLQPLKEVAAYIQANHHLPGIPTEAEVNEKGISLGDIQSKLLAKIEELTLHVIRQENENQELRLRMAQLEKRDSAGAPAAGR